MPIASRRTLLKLLGSTSLAGSLPWLSTRGASAADPESEIPLRVLFLEIPNGVRRSTWEPNGHLAAPPSSVELMTEWDLREVMAPLAEYKSRMTMFENLDMVSDRVDPTGPANAHYAGITHSLTAIDRATENLAGGPSIDQFIAQSLDSPTRRASLNLMGDEGGGQWTRTVEHLSHSASGQPEPYLSYIPDIWDYIFPGEATDASGAVLLRARRTSTANMIRGDYTRLMAQLPENDRVKLEQMLQHRMDIHDRLSISSNRDQNRPLQSSIIDPWSTLTEVYQAGNMENRLWNTHVDLTTQLAAAALHTDTTRVVTLAIGSPPDYELGYAPGDFGTTDWHDLDHQVSGDSPELSTLEAQAAMHNMQLLVMQKVKAVLDTLAGLSESDGGTLLDHTLVVMHSHIGEGSHDLSRLPWAIFGDAHGCLRAGSYVRFPLDMDDNNDFDPTDSGVRLYHSQGRSHGDLWMTVAQAMGIESPVFGNQAISKGVISEILV